MSASPFNLSRIGQNNATGDTRALNLKVFSNEILVAWNAAVMMDDKQTVRRLQNAKESQFLVTGRNTASYHVPGTAIDGNEAKVSEVVISVDAELVSSVSVGNLDEALASADLRRPLVSQLAPAIATRYDQLVTINGIRAARITTPRIDGEAGMVGGTKAVTADAAGLKEGIWSAAQNFDEKFVPQENRNAFFRPAQFYLLARDPELANRDFGSVSDYGKGSVGELAGINIFKNVNLPTGNVTGTFENKYDTDLTGTLGLIMTPDAVGTVKVADLSFNMTGDEYFAVHRATLITAAQLVGHGTLRAECAYELTEEVAP